MPEVRHGSNLKVHSDPALIHVPSDAVQSPILEDSANIPQRPLQQTKTQSADNVPVTKQQSPGRRLSLSFALGRGSSNNVNPASSAAAATGLPPAPSAKSSTNALDNPNATATVGSPVAPTKSGGSRRPSMNLGGSSFGLGRLSINPDRLAGEQLPRQSVSYAQRPDADAYYDSRAGTRKEFKRRGRTLEEYYADNPELLPQLPFTWHHGKRRYRLWLFAFFVVVDASAIPIALYYGMKYAGGVEEYIIFIIVTTIWGGPTYLEFALRTLRLMKKSHFFRPLGTTSRWCADSLTWTGSLTIFVLTVLFIIGSAPHDTWLRVVAMAAVSILWCLGGVLLAIQLLHEYNIPAPFRISSTAKGEKVLPGVYYFIEDVVAVNGRSGRPYREALAARYRASPRFRQMLYQQSYFWSIPSLVMATILTVVGIIPQVPENWSYGVCWTAPFIWAVIWGIITIRWCKFCMVRERLEWEAGETPNKMITPPSDTVGDLASPVTSPV